jgi:hypothetical protein
MAADTAPSRSLRMSNRISMSSHSSLVMETSSLLIRLATGDTSDSPEGTSEDT